MKTLKYLTVIVASIIFIMYLSSNLTLANDNIFEVIATFISITTGFTITALSIIATSSFSKKLYNMEDPNDNSKTLLHVLINNFIKSSILFIITIGFIVILNLYPTDYDGNKFMLMKKVFNDIQLLKSLILYLTIISFYQFIVLLSTFSKFVIKTATE